MPAFAILEPPGHQHAAIEHADRFIFLPDSFSLGAFLFAPLWMIWRRVWVVLIVYLVGVGSIGYGLRLLGLGWTAAAMVFALIHLLVGLEATSLVRWTRIRHGWRERGIVIGDDLDMAERRFFDAWVRRTAAQRSTPSEASGPSSTLPAAADTFSAERSGVIGLFPEPGGHR